MNSYATKSELTASKNGYMGINDIGTLRSASQLTQPGYYQFYEITADVNKDAGIEIFSEYNTGDFYAFLFGGTGINSSTGYRYGTLLITTPRIDSGIWIGTIWEKKFTRWYKVGKTS